MIHSTTSPPRPSDSAPTTSPLPVRPPLPRAPDRPSRDLCLAYQLVSSLFCYPAVPLYNRPGLHVSDSNTSLTANTRPIVAQLVHLIFDTHILTESLLP